MVAIRTIRTVPAAAKYLDKVMPGWFNKIDLSRFNLRWYNTCVLGQLCGEYEYGAAKILGIDIHNRDERGEFSMHKSAFNARSSLSKTRKNNAWVKLIKERQLESCCRS